jgi:hypothetical protein
MRLIVSNAENAALLKTHCAYRQSTKSGERK